MPVKGLNELQNKMVKWWQQLLRDIPVIVEQEALNFFRDRFREQEWLDVTPEYWKGKAPRTKKRGNLMLIESGKLLRSMTGKHWVRNTTVRITVSAPYARVHNEGFDGNVQVKSHVRNSRARLRVRSSSIKTRRELKPKTQVLSTGRQQVKAHNKRMRIPRRQFIGNSQELNMIIKLAILKHADRVWKQL